MKYAQNTEVSAERSRAEIEKTLERYGATGFVYGWQEENALIEFKMKNRIIRFVVALPDRNDKQFRFTPSRHQRRNDAQTFEAWEQATRQRWRALSLAIKAKLEAVESKITTFEHEFLAHTVMPDGRTMAEIVLPQIEQAYQSNQMPKLLLPGTEQ